MPAIRRSNCMRLGTGHPPFVVASKRPIAACGNRHLSDRKAAEGVTHQCPLAGSSSSTTDRGSAVALARNGELPANTP